MTQDRIRRIEEVLDRALDHPTALRDAFVAEACADDMDLRDEVAALLREHRRMGGFLETAAVQQFKGALLAAGERVGSYRIERVLGAGGGGTVYLAEQEQPRRPVALKAMHGGFATDTAAIRFQQEAEILARLQHPAIAHVYDAGVHDGLPYIALEYVENAESILDFAERADLDRHARLHLFAIVCDAVHAGHLKGVVHLDLKPGNILVLPSGLPKIIDFGIARVEGVGAGDEIACTPPYMSPEQGDRGKDLDLRSDVYSLGVVLYELLSARLPHDVSGVPISEAARICQEPPAALDPEIPADLRAITMQAMATDASDRYASAAELATDLRLFVRHMPVAARPAGRLRQLALWARRHAALTAALLALALVLVTGATVSTIFAVRATAARDRERMQAYVANIAAADAALRAYNVGEARQRLEQTPPELRNWEYDHLVARLDQSVRTLPANGNGSSCYDPAGTMVVLADRTDPHLRVIALEDGKVVHEEALEERPQRPVVSPDGRYIVWGDESGGIQVRDGETFERVEPAGGQRPHRDRLYDVAFAADGEQFATCSHDGRVMIWDTHRLAVVHTLQGDGQPYYRVCFDPSGRLLAVSDLQRTIELWNVEEGRRILVFEGHTGIATMIAFTPDGRRLVSGGLDATLRVWDVETGTQQAVYHDRRSHITTGVLSADGQSAITGHVDGTLTLWDLSSGFAQTTLWGHLHPIMSIKSPPGVVISTDLHGVIKLWDLEATASEAPLQYTHLPRDVAFSDDGNLLATGTFDGRVRLRDRRKPAEERALEARQGRVQAVAFSPDGSHLASASDDGTVVWWSTTGDYVDTLEAHAGPALGVAFHPDSRHLASTHDGKTVVWDLDTRKAVRTLAQPGRIWVTLFTADGNNLLTGSESGELWIWDWRAGQKRRRLAATQHPISCAELHPDSQRLAVGSGGHVHVFDTRTWQRVTSFSPSEHTIHGVSWSPDGTRLAIAAKSDVRVLDARTGQTVLQLFDAPVLVWDVAFSPDGDQIAAAIGGYEGQGCEVRHWNR